VRRVPRSPIDQARTDQAHTDQAVRRRRLPAKWLAAALITAAVALLAPGMSYVTAGQSGAATAAMTAAMNPAMNPATAGCRGVSQAFFPAMGFITNPSRAQGGHLWWRRSADGGSVCIGTVIMWVQYNATAAKTWRVIVVSAKNPGGLAVASRTFTLKRGFGVHQAYQDLSAVCVTATDSFGMSCVHFTAPAG
jgi:hypothetical protein